MSDRLQQLALFVRAVETGSFSRTGREFGLSQPSVSRSIAAMEDRLGVKLLLRTTRRLTPTEAGQALFSHAREVLTGLEDAENAARGGNALSGTLRVAIPVAFGSRVIAPLLGDFLALHPGLNFELLMSDRYEDLIAEGVDLALRIGAQSDSSFVARRIGRSPRLVVAAPSYLERRGTPKIPAELAAHDCLRGPSDTSREGWTFRHAGTVTSVAVSGRVRVSSASGLLACAVEGLGIMIASSWMCRAEFESGALVRILEEYEIDPAEAYAVFPGGRQPARKARAFVEYLAAALQK